MQAQCLEINIQITAFINHNVSNNTSSHNFRTSKKKVNNSYILHILNTYCIKSTK